VEWRRADRRGTAPPRLGSPAHAVRRRELARDLLRYRRGALHQGRAVDDRAADPDRRAV